MARGLSSARSGLWLWTQEQTLGSFSESSRFDSQETCRATDATLSRRYDRWGVERGNSQTEAVARHWTEGGGRMTGDESAKGPPPPTTPPKSAHLAIDSRE